MRQTALWVVAGIAWLVVSYFVTLRLTFPSDAIVDRAKFEVDRRSGGSLALDVPHVSPWGFGVSGKDVKLLEVDDGVTTEFLTLDRARVRVSPFSAFSEPHVRGDLRLGDGDVEFAMDLVAVDKKWTPRFMEVEAEEFPLSSLPPIGGVDLDGTGNVDVELRLEAPDAFSTASGMARISGHTLTITDIGSYGELIGGFDLLPAVIDELDLRIEITEGKGRVVRGVLFSSIANIELGGDVTLGPTLQRTKLKMNGTIELTEASESLGTLLAAGLGSPWADSKYHFKITGTVGRPNPTADRERPATTARRTDEVEVDGPAVEASPETEAAAREARERRLERLRERGTRPHAPDPSKVLGPGVTEVPGAVGPDDLVPVDEIPGEETPPEDVPLPEEEPPLEEEPPPPPEEL